MRDVPEIRFVQLSPETLVALIDGDLTAAGAAAGTELSQYLLDEAWLWRIRLEQIGLLHREVQRQGSFASVS